jgi:hypothetical protein
MMAGPRKHLTRVVAILVGAVILVAADQLVQNLSLSRIVQISDDIQDPLIRYRDRRVELETYVTENLSDISDPESFYTTQVARMANDTVPPLQYSYDALSRVIVLPWHTRIDLAKTAMLSHTAAWGEQLASFIDDPETVFTAPNRSAINASWRLLGVSFPEAIPRVDLFSIEERIEAFIMGGQARPPG